MGATHNANAAVILSHVCANDKENGRALDIIDIISGGGIIEPWAVALACIGFLVAGFIDSIAGGGGLISIPVLLIGGLPIHTLIATNKLASSMGTSIATFKYYREGYMKLELVAPCIVFALCGSALGANASLLVNENVIRILMLVVIPIAGFYVLRTKEIDGSGKQPLPKMRRIATCAVIAFALGFYDGFYGPGTGTFLMLLLTGLGHLKITDAAGTTKAINLTTNLAALVVFLVNGAVLIPLGLTCGLFNIAGNYLGARLFTQKGSALCRPIILVVLIIFAIRVICELAGIM